MQELKKSIAGFNIQILLHESRASKLLAKELIYYPDIAVGGQIELSFCFFPPEELSLQSNNPSYYKHYENGFGANFGGYSVDWIFKDSGRVPDVYFYLNNPEKRLWSKLKGMQYTHPYEEIGQIFHEGVLQPTLLMFCNTSIAVVHGAAVVSDNGESYVFGGTGGVGKTSLELELVLSNNFRFLSDDICFLDNKGNIYPNFNFPKIYGYNLLNSPDVKKKLLCKRRIYDRIWWHVQSLLKKPDKYRRRADILDFYSAQIGQSCRIDNFVVLFRSNVQQPEIKKISPMKAAKLNSYVLYTEFVRVFSVFKHQQFNSLFFDKNSSIDFDAIIDNSQSNMVESLKGANCFLVEVPLSYSAQEVKSSVPGLLEI